MLTLGNMILALNAANGEVLPEGLEITTNTLKLAFGGYNPIFQCFGEDGNGETLAIVRQKSMIGKRIEAWTRRTDVTRSGRGPSIETLGCSQRHE